MKMEKDEEIIKKGYVKYPQKLKVNEKLITTLQTLQETEIAKRNYRIQQMSFKDALFDAKVFTDYYFKMHEVLGVKRIKRRGVNGSLIKPVSPYRIPVKLIESDNIFGGGVVETIPKQESAVLFNNIILSKPTTEHTSPSYVHELAHTQLDSVRGSVVYYYNAEVISIFLELVHDYSLGNDETLLMLDDARRIYEMSILANNLIQDTDMSRENILEDSKYLNSDLIAYNLFITYYYGTEQTKKEMLDFIQRIYDGERTVEDFITKYDSSYEESQEPKRLIKYFGR